MLLQVTEIRTPVINALDIIPLDQLLLFLKVSANDKKLVEYIFPLLTHLFLHFQVIDNAFQWAAAVVATSVLIKSIIINTVPMLGENHYFRLEPIAALRGT